MKKMLVVGSFAACLVVSFTAPAIAQTKGGGNGFYAVDSIEEQVMQDGSMIVTVHQKGFVTGNTPTNPFGTSVQDCTGRVKVAADGTEGEVHGSCIGVDRFGDVFYIWFKTDGMDGTWGLMGGTGKFAGMSADGTSRQLTEWSDGRNIISWEGAWK